ncbi:Ig-like domain-containing protein, partial [Psychrobacter sp. B38]|uniref:Ig-like domain-containing protein n=1 Tax=Psychrobacter sp. B38 TaxID=3143538 RepID=UPI0032101D46
NAGGTLPAPVVNATDGTLDSAPTTGTVPVILPDTTPPSAPVVIIGNGDDLVNGFDLNDEGFVEVTVILPADAEVGDTVTVDGMGTVITQDMLDNGYNFTVPAPAQGTVLTVTASVTDQAGNIGPIGTDSATVGNIMAPAVLIPEALDGVNAEEFADGIQTQVTLPDDTSVGDIVTLTVTPDGGTPITIQYEVTAADLDVNGGNGIAEITIPNGAGGISDNGAYTVVATVTDADNNIGVPSAPVGFDLNTTFAARDDSDTLDLGQLQVTYYPPVSDSDLLILGALEGTGGTESNLGFTVSEGASGTVSISVQQTALVAVADAVNIEIYNAAGERVYVGTTGNDPLVGDVIGLELLGLTGNDTLTATVSGLEPGDYTIVVRNDRSVLSDLVNDLTLAELGEAGVVLGPDNQGIIFNAVQEALGPVLGPTVVGLLRPVLTPLLSAPEGLEFEELAETLGGLNLGLGLGLTTTQIDQILDNLVAPLLSNTLTLLETTDITAIVTEFSYADNTVINGNVIDPDASILGEPGEDTVTTDTVITDIDSSTGSEPTSEIVGGVRGFTIQGQYGVLVIDEDGNYTYTANGDFASSGQSETFTYTISDGVVSDTAELVINLDTVVDTTPPDAPTIDVPIAGDNIVNGTEAAASFAVTGTGVSGDTITLTDGSNNILGTAIVDATGNWSINVDQAEVNAMGEGAEQLNATATDYAGNVSIAATATISVDTTVPVAFDNEVALNIGFQTSSTSVPLKSTLVGGLLDLSVLSNTVDVSLLSRNALSFNVAENTTRQVTVDGSGRALVSLGVVGDRDFDLLVYRVEAGSSQATLVQEIPNWLVGSGNLPTIWNANDLPLSRFEDGGTYYVTLGNNGGLLDISLLSRLTLLTTSDVITSYSPPTVINASRGGNVITDIGADGTDVITAGTVVSAVDGIAVTTGTQIIGDYGVLTINQNGSYTYAANTNFTGTFGDVDSFAYTITAPNGEISTANLDITLDYTLPNSGARVALMSIDDSMVYSDLLSDDSDILGITQDSEQEADILNLDVSANAGIIIDDEVADVSDTDFMTNDFMTNDLMTNDLMTSGFVSGDFMLSDFIQMDEEQYIDIATDEEGNTTLAFTGQEVVETAVTVNAASNEPVSAHLETQADTNLTDQITVMSVDNINLSVNNEWENLAQIANTSYIV